MARNPSQRLSLKVTYRGKGPVKWSGGPLDFGVQDKNETLHAGRVGVGDSLTFEIEADVTFGEDGAPVLSGPFVHGPKSGRFLYLSWRNATGEYAQRFKLSVANLDPAAVQRALASGRPLAGELVDFSPKITSTGANIGGSRPIDWAIETP